jgi:hypothetical protein
MAAAGAVKGLASALISITSYGIDASEKLHIMRTRLDALAGGKAGGAQVSAMLDTLRKSSGSSREELAGMAEQLLAMGTPVNELRGKLEALASVNALGLTGGTEAYLKIQAKLQDHLKITTKDVLNLRKAGLSVPEIAAQMGLNVDQFNAAVKRGTINTHEMSATIDRLATAKGLDAVKEKSNSVGGAMTLLKDNVMGLFAKVDVRPLVDGLKKLAAVFDTSSASGKGMGDVIVKVLNAIIKVGGALAGAVAPGIKLIMISFKGLELTFLKVELAYHKVQNALHGRKLQATGGLKGLETEANSVSKALETVGKNYGKDLTPFVEAVKAKLAASGAVQKAQAKAAGAATAQGLADGLNSGTGLAAAAGGSLGAAAVGGIKGALKISSPSQVFHLIGRQSAEGYSKGFEQQEPVARAVQAAARPPAARASAAPAVGRAVHVHFAPGSIVIQAANQNAQELSEHMLTVVLERVALARGLG